METYGKILLIASPAFFVLILIERFFSWYLGQKTYREMDMLSSLSSGITNTVKDVLGLSISILTYGYLVEHIALFHIENTLIVYIIAFIALDFKGYWTHRIAHEVNFFWNNHLVHHSSEEFNLACALRQSISSFVNIFTFFLLPAALLGVPAQVISVVAPLHLFAQFWYHTRLINKMGFLEYIIVTPSHHRVHHAINPEYLDKNYSQIFIIWDKLFGTFQEELKEKPPVYGITKPVSTWNPIKINFQHMYLLIMDALRTKNWGDKFRIFWMPTGWRPEDVKKKYPISKIEDPYHFEKYNPLSSIRLKTWSWIQLIITLTFSLYFYGNLASIGSPNIFVYGAFLYLLVYSYTDLMDRNRFALFWEVFKNIWGLGMLLLLSNDWFGAGMLVSWILLAYFIVSTLVTAYFVLVEFKKESSMEVVNSNAMIA